MRDWNDALLVRRQMDFNAGVWMDVADVVDADLRLHDQRILLRHKIQDLVAPSDDAADRKPVESNDVQGPSECPSC